MVALEMPSFVRHITAYCHQIKFGKVANAKNIKVTYGINLFLPPSTVMNRVKHIWTDNMRSRKYQPLFIKYLT